MVSKQRSSKEKIAGIPYEKLEPRRLLASDSTNVIFAADFEDVEVVSGEFGMFAGTSGFQATRGLVEVQNNHWQVGAASSGNQLLELDGNNGVSTQITAQSQALTLTFDYSPRPGVASPDNSIEVWWNNELIETISGNGANLETAEFQIKSITLPAVNSCLLYTSPSPRD